MSIRAHMLALACASLMAAAPLAANADNMQQPLPGQPGADTTVGQELRGAPYMVMMVTSGGMMTEHQVNAATASELMKHAKPTTGMMVLMHDGKAYTVDNMKMKNGKMLYDELDLPENLIN
ncbi:MAG TPA: hypothetical protein VGF92_18525 [Stellaceae bacterium]|jgi:hypothetical protein